MRSLAMTTWSVSNRAKRQCPCSPHFPLCLHTPSQGLWAINSGEAGMRVRGSPGPHTDTDVSSLAWPGPIPLASPGLGPRQASAYHQLHSPWLYLAPDLRERWASPCDRAPRPGCLLLPGGGATAAYHCICNTHCVRLGLQAALLDEQINDLRSCPKNLDIKNRGTQGPGRMSYKTKCISLYSIQSSLFRNGPKSSSSHPISLPSP